MKLLLSIVAGFWNPTGQEDYVGNAAMLVALLLSGVVSATLGVLQWWLRLRFLRHVYDRGGSADLGVADVALRSIDEESAHEPKASDGLPATHDEQPPD